MENILKDEEKVETALDSLRAKVDIDDVQKDLIYLYRLSDSVIIIPGSKLLLVIKGLDKYLDDVFNLEWNTLVPASTITYILDQISRIKYETKKLYDKYKNQYEQLEDWQVILVGAIEEYGIDNLRVIDSGEVKKLLDILSGTKSKKKSRHTV